MLVAADVEERKQGAWRVADPDGALTATLVILPRLEKNEEPDAGVREAYVYALGQMKRPRFFDTLEPLIRTDPSGYVRQAAWLAAARSDERRFRELVGSQPDWADPWDQIGIARGWLVLGDVRGVDVMLHWATRGDEVQRALLAELLYRDVAPILEAAGRWPLAAPAVEGKPWPPAFVADLGRRCGEVNLQRVLSASRRSASAAEQVRRDVGRLARARERIKRFLFGP